MQGWIITNGFLHSEKFDELTALFLDSALRRNMTLIPFKNTDILVELSADDGGRVFHGMSRPDFILFWDKDILLAEYFETFGIRVYNSSRAIAVCDDKRKCHLALQKMKIPMPGTSFAPMTYANIGFTHLDFLQDIIESLGFPMVVKAAFGSFGQQVWLAKGERQLMDILQRCPETEILFQEFISESSGRDIRLQVVGGEVVGAMLRYSKGDFRANVSAGGRMEQYSPTAEESRLALQAARAVGADFAGVDVLFGKKGPVVCEVNSNAHFKNLLDCSGVNTADAILQYIQTDILSDGEGLSCPAITAG